MDVAEILAFHLSMDLVFTTEFVELNNELRDPGKGEGGGVHGNAILSKFRIVEAWSFVHTCQPFDWQARAKLSGEPRLGGRIALGALIELPWKSIPFMIVYSVHLENFSGAIGRYRQFAEILQDIGTRPKKLAALAGVEESSCPVVVGGDLNTLVGGWTRLIRSYNDRLSLAFLGKFEAEYWERALLAPSLTADSVHPLVRPHFVTNSRALRDPFDKAKDVTMTQTRHSLFRFSAKLDWLLLSRELECVRKDVGGHLLSDHCYVVCDVQVRPQQ